MLVFLHGLETLDNRSIPVGFQPDLVWTKRRDTALDHFMWDSVRGAASELYPNQPYEAGTASPLRFGGFYYDGFIVNNHSSVNQCELVTGLHGLGRLVETKTLLIKMMKVLQQLLRQD